jgi:hypothetical protein
MRRAISFFHEVRQGALRRLFALYLEQPEAFNELLLRFITLSSTCRGLERVLP